MEGSNTMARGRWTVLALAVGLLAALAVWRGRQRVQSAASAPASPVSASPSAGINRKERRERRERIAGTADGLEEMLRSAQAALHTAQDAGSKRQQLAALRQALSSMPSKNVTIAIRKFLDSKADAGTGQGFKIGGHGVLSEAPTLRAMLLDQLGQIDPAAAAAYAREILSRSDSADEWAVSLRNLAWGDASPEGRALLQQKVGEL